MRRYISDLIGIMSDVIDERRYHVAVGQRHVEEAQYRRLPLDHAGIHEIRQFDLRCDDSIGITPPPIPPILIPLAVVVVALAGAGGGVRVRQIDALVYATKRALAQSTKAEVIVVVAYGGAGLWEGRTRRSISRSDDDIGGEDVGAVVVDGVHDLDGWQFVRGGI